MTEPAKSAASIRFGRFELSAETGELRKDGARLKLAGQAIQVLAMLAANPGKLISREELQQKLWPGASYGDPEHGLNAAVNRLREALGDSATEPKYIETVPGRGYRFIAALDLPAVPPEPEPPEPEPEPPKPPRWKRKATVAVTACVVVAALLYPWIAPRIEWLLRQNQLRQVKVVPLTTLPGSVGSPTFSPDGSQIAFVWHDETYAPGFDLYVKVIGEDKPLRLTHWPNGVNTLWASWSPDGRNIAVCRLAVRAGSAVYLVSPLGGMERRITSMSCASDFVGGALSWSADGKQLAFLHYSPSDETLGLFVLSMDSMEAAQVKSDCKEVILPAFSPRGDYLAWACDDKLNSVPIYLKRLSDGKVTQLLRGVQGVGGLAWSDDGRRIVFSTGFGSFVGGDLWEVAVDRPDRPTKLPFGHDAKDVAVSFTGHRLAFKQAHANTNIWRVNLSDPKAHAEKIVASSREQTSPNYSPDGTQIAFASNRSGNDEIWVADSDGTNAVQLSSFGINMTGTPRWSPDGKLIAFDSQVGGESNIYLVEPHGGLPRKLSIDIRGNGMPSWSHDGNWIYFVNGDDIGNPTVWKVASRGGHAAQVAQHAGYMPLESPDGRYVYFSHDGQLWQVKVDGTGEQQIQGIPPVRIDGWNPFGPGIYFMTYANNKTEIDYFDLNTKAARTIFIMDKWAPDDWIGGLPVSPDGKWMLFAQLDQVFSDLMMVENWQ
jgi:Tol biopolymer transport system component/DNA-binding winged helix-turn-helix (wHTH) protein